MIMIYWSLVILVLLLVFIWYKYYKLKEVNTNLVEKLIEDQKKPILLGKVEAFTEEDLYNIQSSPDTVDIILKVFEYKIAKKNDEIRFATDWEDLSKKIWGLNCLYDTHLFFYKIKNMPRQ